ncbi:hypothetical protein OG21DRAFT_1484286 [Imleria badia]|nr:hypothetical protein OG21DRAFT_1484286 [Imleria badia]
MPTTPAADDPNLQTMNSKAFVHTSTSLCYAVTHVFLPVQLPNRSDYTPENNLSLARAVCAAAHAYGTYVCGTSEQAQWHRITRMLDNLQASVRSEHMDDGHVISQLRGMETGDILVFFIRCQNAGIILTKRESSTLCEAFEVSPSQDAVDETPGPLICSYPGSTVETPNEVFDEGAFQSELAQFLCRPNADDSDSPLPPPADPKYINALFNGILQSVGRAADVPRVTKRPTLLTGILRKRVDRSQAADTPRIIKHVRDHVGGLSNVFLAVKDVWRRSPLWLLIRVAIQMSVNHTLGPAQYKRFILFFICTLARDQSNTNLSSDLLHLMSSKIIRRSSKLGSSVPNWLSEIALKACTCLREILDARWKELRDRPYPFRNPSQDDLTRDTQLLLLNSREYIQNALTNPGHKSVSTPFHPSHRRRGTIEDFLSSNGTFFDEAYAVDRDATMYDVERSVQQGIDDWLTCVTNVDEACAQLEILMDRYMTKAHEVQKGYPEDMSIMLLTGIELFVALDKLAVKEVPMLADYPPEIPIEFLERLLLRKAISLHRLSCAYQYLSVRHSRSRSGWWALLDAEFTKDSFPVRYYDQSPHLQQLKARIEAEKVMYKDAGGVGPQHGSAGLARTLEEYQECRQDLPGRRLAECALSPLPALPLHAKVVVFELQCPPCIRIWRSAAPRILLYFYNAIFDDDPDAEDETWHSALGRRSVDSYEEHHLLARVPALQPYLVERQGPPLRVQIHLAYLFPREYEFWPRNGPMLRYVVQHPDLLRMKDSLSMWQPRRRYSDGELSFNLRYHHCLSGTVLEEYVHYTSHTSNDVLSAQVDCPEDLTPDEFVAFGHLRSGGSLQWLNILQGLRSRTLNLRRHQVHYLLANAVFHVGPLNLNTGTWIWHYELQDSFFCNALLDELENLFVDVGAGSMDGVLMYTISLLLTRVLASSPSEGVSDRVIALLRSVRRTTFGWVQDLSYDLAKAPTNEERRNLLLDMAATCRSTFDVDPDYATVRKLFHSAEDVDALLSCAFFIHTLRPKVVEDLYLRLLIGRDDRLFLALEEILRDVILADVSDYGMDLAVGKIVVRYQPGRQRWEQLQYPNVRWVTCETDATVDQASQTVHINLLDGTLRLNGQLLGGLPREAWASRECQQIFHDQGFFVIPSNLPGMDFTTLAMMSEHKVHFSLRDDNVVVQVQGNHRNEILELIPSSKVLKDLPPVLVDGHVYWLNLSTQIIEIRPLKQLWEASSEHWRIDCTSGQYRMYRDDETLVDIRSPTWEMVSNCFECLNIVDNSSLGQKSSDDLLVTIDSVQSTLVPRLFKLSVILPHYGLSFFVNEGEELESHDFKDMVYDEVQCIGTLFGLENLLVLRPKNHLAGTLIPEALIYRRVVVPDGSPIKHGDDRARIDMARTRECDEPLYHTYNVDTELGCLIGNGSLTSMQFLASLHAMTSCHRPDPLTGKTGAQAALCLLQSAGCRSIMKLKDFDVRSWTSAQYPQIVAAYNEIRNRHYWDRDSIWIAVLARNQKPAARRAAYLFPSNATGPTYQEDHDESKYLKTCGAEKPGLDQLFSSRPAPEIRARSTLLQVRGSHNAPSNEVSALHKLFSSLRTDPSFQQEYLTRLDASAQHLRLESHRTYTVASASGSPIEVLKKHFVQCRTNYLDSLDILKKSLGPTTDPQEQALDQFVQWSPITADVLLRYLASTSPINIPPRWKKCLTSLALLLLDLQRARRLLLFALDGLKEEVSKELENEGCDGWDAEEYPDWLLIQIQGNFLIRRAQAETAMEMISPQSGNNTAMQVNMGEGKSSMIIPIVAAALADGKQLARVVVPKALTVQMFESLVARLGALTNRPVYHLPFSRTPEYNHDDEVIGLQIDDLRKLMSQCMAERGILLVQPEHVLSLKLMAVEEQIPEGKPTTSLLSNLHWPNYKHTATALSLKSLDNEPQLHASKWLSLEKWLHSHIRDILDESDEILHTRFQLVYTMGTQKHMDGYPERWTITQQVLRLVKKHVYSLSSYTRSSIEYERGPPGSFPHIRILQGSDVGPRLKALIVEDVMAGQLLNLNFQHISPALHSAIRSFIKDEDVIRVPDTVKKVEEYAKCSDQSHLWGGLLLLRGLLTSNILLFALSERRWRVDYGLALQPRSRGISEHSPTPTMLAVPYRAKDVPVPNTQFGHPDLTIVLTCLSYYYAGLSKEQLKVSFEILLDEDDPSAEYALWIKECESVPVSLQKISDINLRSSEQWDNVILPYFARNQAAIDFYLSRVVFPMEAQEFPYKLSGSSWDLAEKREQLITGFSGTNDSRWLLPMSIAQRDLDHQKGTDARVLSYLLQPENNSYTVVAPESCGIGERFTTRALLRMVAMQNPEIRVLIDVGSQILDLSNYHVAAAWLGIARDTTGVIYFNENDELVVLTKNGKSVPMLSSSLSQQLDRCVVYLDHAHTRGTDIKLPIRSRAAVMLGPKVTKDALVQGCMRMRKLGHGHSVMFFAPLEVDRNIRAMTAKTDPNTQVTPVDILCWAIHETWSDIQQRAPYWAQQGMSHISRNDAWSRFVSEKLTRKQLADAWLQPELKSLADLYAPCETKNASSDLSELDPGIRQRCKDLGVLSLPSAQMEEEQEREVNRQREREREVELPPGANPAKHYLDPAVVKFVKTGAILSFSAFRPVFTMLDKSYANTRDAIWSPSILATADFCKTIQPQSTPGTMDQYHRPAQWILSSKNERRQILVLLSPFEANRLMPDIRASKYVHLHVYAPRTSQRMKPSDDLQLHTIPPLPSDWTPPWALIDQLNLFAGQLYLRDYESYLRLCRLLGIPATKEARSRTVVQRNLPSVRGGSKKNEMTSSGSPLPFVQALLAIRRRGLPFAQTHMGKILQGQVLTEKDFQRSCLVTTIPPL